MRVLICGGGVIGASIASFLAKRGARRSFALHASLAEEIADDWGSPSLLSIRP